ncbi:MAG: glycosyltransferase family 2 protein [Rhodospirillales bacterium]
MNSQSDSPPVEGKDRGILLSIIVPVFNEEEILPCMADGIIAHMKGVLPPDQWEFVFCDNGSRDASRKVIGEIAKRHVNCQCRELPKSDFGAAISDGMLHARGRWAWVINVDWWDIPMLEWAWQARESYDMIIGSKRADPTLNQQNRYRRTLSWGLNAVLQFAFGFVGSDTHGQKLLDLNSMREIISACQMTRGQFDTELTLRALRQGLWLAEVPIPVREVRKSRNLMIRKITQNIYDIIRLKFVMLDVPSMGVCRYHRWSREDVLNKNVILQRSKNTPEQNETSANDQAI